MPTHVAHTYTPTEAAAIIGVSASQVRNWCTQFADYLSTDANPAPGQTRTLTQADVATLQRVKELRDEGIDYADIPAQLDQLDPGELVPYVDVDPSPLSTVNEPGTAQHSPQAAIELFGKLEDRFQQMQGQIDRLQAAQAEEDRGRMSAVTLLGLGVIAGILLVGIVIGIIALGAWLGGVKS